MAHTKMTLKKNPIARLVRETITTLDALEILFLPLFGFGALVYGLLRAIRAL